VPVRGGPGITVGVVIIMFDSVLIFIYKYTLSTHSSRGVGVSGGGLPGVGGLKNPQNKNSSLRPQPSLLLFCPSLLSLLFTPLTLPPTHTQGFHLAQHTRHREGGRRPTSQTWLRIHARCSGLFSPSPFSCPVADALGGGTHGHPCGHHPLVG
jgi:hypothetical protein